MPKGDNPKSRANLSRGKPFSAENARKAQIVSAEKRRASTRLTDSLKAQLTEEEMNEIVRVLIKKARQGNLKAYEIIRDQMGEKPLQRIHTNFKAEDMTETVNNLQIAIETRRKNTCKTKS